jgi:hypothetical protein
MAAGNAIFMSAPCRLGGDGARKKPEKLSLRLQSFQLSCCSNALIATLLFGRGEAATGGCAGGEQQGADESALHAIRDGRVTAGEIGGPPAR